MNIGTIYIFIIKTFFKYLVYQVIKVKNISFKRNAFMYRVTALPNHNIGIRYYKIVAYRIMFNKFGYCKHKPNLTNIFSFGYAPTLFAYNNHQIHL